MDSATQFFTHPNQSYEPTKTRWWFQRFWILTLKMGEDFPFWLIFFKWVGSTTNQKVMWSLFLGRSAESQNDLLFYNVLSFEMPQEEGTAGLWKIYWFGVFFQTSGIQKLRKKKLFYLGFFLPLASFPTLFAAVIYFFLISCLNMVNSFEINHCL